MVCGKQQRAVGSKIKGQEQCDKVMVDSRWLKPPILTLDQGWLWRWHEIRNELDYLVRIVCAFTRWAHMLSVVNFSKRKLEDRVVETKMKWDWSTKAMKWISCLMYAFDIPWGLMDAPWVPMRSLVLTVVVHDEIVGGEKTERKEERIRIWGRCQAEAFYARWKVTSRFDLSWKQCLTSPKSIVRALHHAVGSC